MARMLQRTMQSGWLMLCVPSSIHSRVSLYSEAPAASSNGILWSFTVTAACSLCTTHRGRSECAIQANERERGVLASKSQASAASSLSPAHFAAWDVAAFDRCCLFPVRKRARVDVTAASEMCSSRRERKAARVPFSLGDERFGRGGGGGRRLDERRKPLSGRHDALGHGWLLAKIEDEQQEGS